jgi:Lrp/AsnC family leucine-responsive transcriptional regulator
MEIDAIDRTLLAAVQSDATQTAEQLATRVSLSASAAQRRLNRLREAGVIRREVAVVSHEAVGRPFLLIVAVKVENEHEPAATRFVRRLTSAPEVMQCYYVTGQADYILVCTFRDMSEYEAFSQKMFIEAPNVVSFTTSVVITPLKMTLQVPVD